MLLIFVVVYEAIIPSNEYININSIFYILRVRSKTLFVEISESNVKLIVFNFQNTSISYKRINNFFIADENTESV